jgi:hypothetical protein
MPVECRPNACAVVIGFALVRMPWCACGARDDSVCPTHGGRSLNFTRRQGATFHVQHAWTLSSRRDLAAARENPPTEGRWY